MDVQQPPPPPAPAQHEQVGSSLATPPRTLKRKVQCSPVLEGAAVEGQGQGGSDREPSASSERRKRRVLEAAGEEAVAAQKQRPTVMMLWRSLGDAYDHTFGLDHKTYRTEQPEQPVSPLTTLLRVGVVAEAKLIDACLADADDDDDVEEDDAEPGSQQQDDEDTTDVEDDGGDHMVTTNEKRKEKDVTQRKEPKDSPNKATQAAAAVSSTSSSSSTTAPAATRIPSKAEQLLLRAIEAPTPMPMIRMNLRRQYQRLRALHQRADEDLTEAMMTEAWIESGAGPGPGPEVERHLTRFSARGPLLFSEDYITAIKERERREAERWTRNLSASSTSTSTSGGNTQASSTGGGTGVRHRRQRRRGRRRQQLNYSFDGVDSDDSSHGSDHSEDYEENADWADEDGGGEDDESNPGDRFGHDYESAIVPHGANTESPRQRQSSSTSTTSSTTTTTTSNSALQGSASASASGKRRRLETSPSRPDGDEEDVGERFSMADDDYDTQNDDSETIVPRPPLLNIDPAMEAGSDESDEDTQPME